MGKKINYIIKCLFNDLRLKLNNTCFINLDFDRFTCLKSFFFFNLDHGWN